MALLLSNIEAQLLQTIATIPADGAAASAFDFSGVKIEAGKPLLLKSDDGVAQTIDLSSWEFDAAATTGNPVTVQIQGFDCTLIVPASVPARVTAGDVVIEAISPFWTPQEITATKFYGLYAGDSSTYDDSGDGSYPDWFGGSRVASKQNAGAAVYNAASGVVELRAGTSALLLDTGFGGSPYIFISVAQMIGQRGNQGIQGSTSSSAWYHRLDTNDGGSASTTRAPDGGKAHWNGILDGAGALIETDIDNASWPHPNASGASSNKAPLETPFFGLSFDRNFSGNLRNLLFRYSDSNTAMSADIRAYFVFTSTPTNDEIFKLQGWAAWDLINAFGGDIDADYLLSSNHPYYSGPPLLAGGGSSSVTVVAPVASYGRTVSGAPTGAAIAIFKRAGSLIADRSQFTLAAGNGSGDGTLVINETIPADTPTSGFIRVLRDDGDEDRLAYASWSGSTFTLDSATLPVAYSSGNGAYVGYLDVLGSATGTETVSLQYVSSRNCVLTARLGSGGDRIREIRQNVTLGASDFEFQVSAIADSINTST